MHLFIAPSKAVLAYESGQESMCESRPFAHSPFNSGVPRQPVCILLRKYPETHRRSSDGCRNSGLHRAAMRTSAPYAACCSAHSRMDSTCPFIDACARSAGCCAVAGHDRYGPEQHSANSGITECKEKRSDRIERFHPQGVTCLSV